MAFKTTRRRPASLLSIRHGRLARAYAYLNGTPSSASVTHSTLPRTSNVDRVWNHSNGFDPLRTIDSTVRPRASMTMFDGVKWWAAGAALASAAPPGDVLSGA